MAPTSRWAGFFISLEGIDGAGKSTQGAALAGELSRAGHDVVILRPNDTQLGDLLRGYLLQQNQLPVDPWTEALLFTAGRVQLLRERILPALKTGAVVIADRYANSTIAYQGGGRGLPVSVLRQLHKEACRGVWPDLTFLMEIPRRVAKSRQRSQQLPLDRFEVRRRQLSSRRPGCLRGHRRGGAGAGRPRRCQPLAVGGLPGDQRDRQAAYGRPSRRRLIPVGPTRQPVATTTSLISTTRSTRVPVRCTRTPRTPGLPGDPGSHPSA